MQKASDYPDLLVWLRNSRTLDTDTGQMVDGFTENGQLWGKIDMDSGRRQTDFGATETGADVTITIRQWPEVSALDRLRSVQWGDEYIVDSVRRGANELLIDAHKFDALEI